MIFAAGLVLEREPLQWGEFPAATVDWVKTAGIVSAIGLAIWLLAYLLRHPRFLASFGAKTQFGEPEEKPWSVEARVFAWSAAITGILFGVALIFGLAGLAGFTPDEGRTVRTDPSERPPLFSGLGDILFTLATLAALLTVSMPLLQSIFTRFRARRIWAIARLSLKEALHSRVVLIFSLMAIIFLFADWFVPFKPEDQLRNYVRAIYWTMPFLFLMTALILGAFTIPTDLRKQTIHTIVTKPVEKFEILLGRFVGFGILMTIGMAILSGLSLLYVVRGVSEAAARESYKARMPIYGELSFWGTRGVGRVESQGENVGRIWDYRGYITGKNPAMPQMPRMYAIWSFHELPNTADQTTIQVEFTFDIFRLSKGKREKPDVPCTLTFVDGRFSVAEIEKLEQAYKTREGQLFALGKKRDQIEEQLISEFHMFRRGGVEVTDYHTQSLEVPVSFFAKVTPGGDSDAFPRPDKAPLFKVLVEVEEDRETQQTQMVGVARRDLYLLPREAPFWQNFLKGMIGQWFLVLLVLGVALALSTYLSGVIAFLCTLFLILAGTYRDFIEKLASGMLEGGGPLESAIRLGKGRPLMTPLDPGPGAELVQGLDNAFAWVLGRFMNILPDVNRFDLHEYVASGFDIPWLHVLFLDNLLPMLAYLIPCAILAYYLLRFREVANPG